MTKYSLNVESLLPNGNVDYDFTLIINDKKYMINSLIASTHSKKLFNLFFEDPIATECSIKGPNGDYGEVINFLNGNKINPSPYNAIFLFSVSNILQSTDLFEIVRDSLTEPLDPTDALNLCQESFQNRMDCEYFAKIVALSFNSMVSSNKLPSNIDHSILDIILQNCTPDNDIDPTLLKNYLDSTTNIIDNPNDRLLSLYPFSICTIEQINTLLNTKGFNINKVKDTLLKRTLTSNCRVDNFSIYSPIPGKLLEGIIHLFQTPEVTCSSSYKEGYDPTVLLEKEDPSSPSKKYYCSKGGPNEWIQFKFNSYGINVTKYAIKSWYGASNKVSPSSWVLYGREGDSDWEIIDSRDDQTCLCQDGHEEVFDVTENKNFYTSIKLEQLKTYNQRNKVFAIAGFELFGKVKHL